MTIICSRLPAYKYIFLISRKHHNTRNLPRIPPIDTWPRMFDDELMDVNSGILFVLPSLLKNLLQEQTHADLMIKQLQVHFPDLDETKLSQAKELISQCLEAKDTSRLKNSWIVDQDKSILLTLMYGDIYLQALDLAMTGIVTMNTFGTEAGISDISTYLHQTTPPQLVIFKVRQPSHRKRSDLDFTNKLQQIGLKLGDYNNPLQFTEMEFNEVRENINDIRNQGKTYTVGLSDWYCNCDDYQSCYKEDLKMVTYKELIRSLESMKEQGKSINQGSDNHINEGKDNQDIVNDPLDDTTMNHSTNIGTNNDSCSSTTITSTITRNISSPLDHISQNSLHISPLPICPHLLALLIIFSNKSLYNPVMTCI